MLMARTGRPRGFSRDEAVEQAMHLFWEHGYEATSLALLREAMGGISSASFYAAFASKEAVFRDALALYADRHSVCLASLFDPDAAPRSAIEDALRGSIDMQTEDDHPLGCLVCSSAASCSSEAAGVQRLVAEVRDAYHGAIRDCVERAVRLGQLSDKRDLGALAAAFNGFLVGISTQARDGVSRSVLQSAATEIMLLWPVTT